MPINITNIGTAIPSNDEPRLNNAASSAGITPQYQIILDVTGDEAIKIGRSIFPIVAALPERYNIGLSSSWDTPFANMSIGDSISKFGSVYGKDIPSNIIDTGLGVLGIGTRHKYQMAQVWQSTSPLSFNIDFVFNAQTNTEKDVRSKHIALLKLITPSVLEGGILAAPGPNILKSTISGRNISLQLGTYIRMENIIVKDVSADVQTICGADGIPHSMTVNVAFESFYAGMTTDEIDKMFL
jgi:hypothetical protein